MLGALVLDGEGAGVVEEVKIMQGQGQACVE